MDSATRQRKEVIIGGMLTRSNGDYLRQKFGRMPSAGELYIAHFLGAQGAEKLFDAGLRNPDQIAAKLFPKQAEANRSLFYSDGQPRTIRELYRVLVAKHEGGPSATFAAQQMAGQGAPIPQPPVIPSRFSQEDMSFTSLFRTESNLPVSDEPGPANFFMQLYGQ